MIRRSIENRVRRDLRIAVETAVPRGTWEDVAARLDRRTPPTQTEDVIMLDTPTRQIEDDVTEPGSSSRGLLVGAVSAALLAAVIGVAALAARGDDGSGPADDSSPIATAEAVVEVFTAGDREAFMAFFADDALAVNSAFFNDVPLGRLDVPATRRAFEGSVDAAAVAWEREPLISSSCREEGPRVVCDLTYEGSLGDQPESQRLELRIENGMVASFRQRAQPVDPEATEDFLLWFAELEETSARSACDEIDYASTECGELFFELLDRYVAERDAQG